MPTSQSLLQRLLHLLVAWTSKSQKREWLAFGSATFALTESVLGCGRSLAEQAQVGRFDIGILVGSRCQSRADLAQLGIHRARSCSPSPEHVLKAG